MKYFLQGFLKGLSCMFDIWNSPIIEPPKHGSIADDWKRVGNDMRKAMNRNVTP